jgi:hypothetical protein
MPNKRLLPASHPTPALRVKIDIQMDVHLRQATLKVVAINPIDWVIPDKRGMMFKWIKDPFILGTDGTDGPLICLSSARPYLRSPLSSGR